jgi:hypothetical protein
VKGGLPGTTSTKTLISRVPIRQIKHSWGAGDGWSKSLYLTHLALHNRIMLGEFHHLKWIDQAW